MLQSIYDEQSERCDILWCMVYIVTWLILEVKLYEAGSPFSFLHNKKKQNFYFSVAIKNVKFIEKPREKHKIKTKAFYLIKSNQRVWNIYVQLSA